MPEVPIQPKNRFSYIRLPRSTRAHLLENFEGLPLSNGRDDVRFYKLFPWNGGDSGDRVEVLGADRHQARVNEITRGIIEPSRQPLEPPPPGSTRKEGEQYLDECIRDDGFHFKDLVSPKALSFPESIPSFGVFLDGNFRAGGDRDQDELVLVVRIPYLGPERISPPEPEDGLGPRESWNISEFINKVVTGLEDNPLGDYGLSVHQAIFVVLNNAAIMVSKSKEDQDTKVVYPQQERVGVFHVLVHMISEMLGGVDRDILVNLKSQATFLGVRSLLPDGGSRREVVGKTLRSIAATEAVVAEQTAILEDLKDIFGRVVPDVKYPDAHSNRYTKNMLHIPVLSGPAERAKGQMDYAAAALEAIIEDRRKFIETIQKTQATVAVNGQVQDLKEELSAQAEAQAERAQEQRNEARDMRDEAYFSPGSDNKRNGAVGTSLGRFWAVTAPATLLVYSLLVYIVYQGRYEPHQIIRLLVDFFKGKGWVWPMGKADAKAQKSYLRALPRYRVVAAVLAAPGLGSGEVYNLKGPDIEPGAGKDELPLRVEYGDYNTHVFRYDEENGWLFHDWVDEYDYIYYVHAAGRFAPPFDGELPLLWKRSRMPMERKPYRFEGAFQTDQGGTRKFLGWASPRKRRNSRWDTNEFVYSSYFAREGQRLFVRAPESKYGTIYGLELIPAATTP